MSTEKSAGQESPAPDQRIDPRTRRAACQYLTVLENQGRVRGVPDFYEVVSQSGNTYLVDAREKSCTCPDAQQRDPGGGCKHIRRVEIVRGERVIPAEIDPDDVDDAIGEHVDGTVRWEVSP